MKAATLDDIISVSDFSVVCKSSFRKTILLVLSMFSLERIFKSLWYLLRFHIPYAKHEHSCKLITPKTISERREGRGQGKRNQTSS